MICPTEFCSVKPMTIDPMPNAVNNPPICAPQMYARMSPTPMAMSPNLMTSRKIAGMRCRQLPAGALENTDARMPASNSISTSTATTVPTRRTGMDVNGICVAPTMASNNAPRGTSRLRIIDTGRNSGLARRRSACCHSVSAINATGSPRATPTAQ